MNLDEMNELGWSDWNRWRWAMNRGSATVHYANLTRGVHCAPRTAHLCRIQSTQCEAKQWERVLGSIPDEMIALAALGQFIVVHDFSERERETRAMWQGLTLAKIMMEYRWFGELRSRYPTTGRLGRSGTQYLRNVASSAPKHVKARFDYFRELTNVNDTRFVGLVSCRAASRGTRCDFGAGNTPPKAIDRPPADVW